MSHIEVQPTEDGALIFTVTPRDQAPWGSTNTTIFVTGADLASLSAKLQACLQEMQQRQAAIPAFAAGQYVQVVRTFRQGQHGKIIEVQPKEPRLAQRLGEPWVYTVAFEDDATWRYNASDLARRTQNS